MEETELLLHLVTSSDDFTEIKTSTVKIAKSLKRSQQTISRNLISLESKGLITRNVKGKESVISITEKGIGILRGIYKSLEKVLGSINVIDGIVINGLGEGKYYMSLKGYVEQFVSKLGFKPFEGTLNVRVKKADTVRFLGGIEPIRINGFETKERTFGALNCYRIKVGTEKRKSDYADAAIASPDRTTHPNDVVEVIAPFSLRERFKLKDEDVVRMIGND